MSWKVLEERHCASSIRLSAATFTQQFILEALNNALSDATQARRRPSTLYGDGRAEENILRMLETTDPVTLLRKRFQDWPLPRHDPVA